ncbi:hypothetical protein [Lewinella sp. IMCC34183]|uniref:hypothetical protein n=1 Tax=Lewinella sp. IMCC34183 TaxID=2248762 RepID=UPI000E28361A|nr:hypothetical protein [Lewinella sp. IMCC34183]
MAAKDRPAFGQRFLDYLLQVSLIIIGLIIATSVDRCNTARKDRHRLTGYYQAIYKDLEEEQNATANNLGDAIKDVANLDAAIRRFGYADPDSAVAGLTSLNAVLRKGVFRTFSPTTYDVMLNTGDISLIRDIELRSELAGVFAYRTNIVRTDLADYDALVAETIAALAAYIDPACIVEFRAAAPCIRDVAGLADHGLDSLVLLSLAARDRLFHLQLAEGELEAVAKRVGEVLKD